MPDPDKPKLLRSWQFLVLLAAVALVMGRACGFDYLSWDDQTYLLDNPLLRAPTLSHLAQLWQPGGMPDERIYIPLSYTTFWLEARLLGLTPAVTHSLNVLLHALNACLLLLFLARLSGRPGAALAVSLLFAVHPLQVEAVAWAISRKDLLSTTFALLALLAHARSEPGRRRWLLASLAACILAGLAKPTMLILPALLYLADWYRDGRPRPPLGPGLRLLPHLAAMFVLWGLNRLQTSQLPEVAQPPLKYVLLVYLPAVVNGWLARLLLLQPPSPVYPLESFDFSGNGALTLWPSLLLLGWLGWAAWRHRRDTLFGFAFAALCLAPALTMITAFQRYFLTADRYGYLGLAGLFLVVALLAEKHGGSRGAARSWGRALLAGFIVAAGVQSWRQTGLWRNSDSFWRGILARQPGYATAWGMLGNEHFAHGRNAEAVACYTTAVRLDPGYSNGHFNLGRVAEQLQDWDQARQHYRHAIIASPRHVQALVALANLANRAQDSAQARRLLEQALAIDPRHPGALFARGMGYKQQGDLAAARADFAAAAAVAPSAAGAHFQLGVVSERLNRPADATAAYRRALELTPDDTKALYNLGMLYLATGQGAAAQSCLSRFVRLAPDDPDVQGVYLNLGLLARQQGQWPAALEYFAQALAKGPLTDARARALVIDACRAARSQGIALPPTLAALLPEP